MKDFCADKYFPHSCTASDRFIYSTFIYSKTTGCRAEMTKFFREFFFVKQFRKLLPAIGFVFLSLLTACNSVPEKTRPDSGPSDSDKIQQGRYAQNKDSGPGDDIDLSHIPDAVPRKEVRTIAGNKNPYTVLGKTYRLIKDESSYKERGFASWYGKKFNGYKTSNGEIYDMYAMTAAHKTLPIPSYVRVTNLQNGKTVVVRVNDRGPFHEGRIIDLSYAAAQRIGIHKMGTGKVEVEIVMPNDPPAIPRRAEQTIQAVNNSRLPDNTYLQVAAFANREAAKNFAAAIAAQISFLPVVHSETQPKEVHRVRVGPFKTSQELEIARQELAKKNFTDVHLVYVK